MNLFKISGLFLIRSSDDSASDFGDSPFYEGEDISVGRFEKKELGEIIAVDYSPFANDKISESIYCITSEGVKLFMFYGELFKTYLRNNGELVEIEDITPKQKMELLKFKINETN